MFKKIIFVVVLFLGSTAYSVLGEGGLETDVTKTKICISGETNACIPVNLLIEILSKVGKTLPGFQEGFFLLACLAVFNGLKNYIGGTNKK